MKKYGELNYSKPKGSPSPDEEDDLKFVLWKAELNKELYEFWKVLTKEDKKTE